MTREATSWLPSGTVVPAELETRISTLIHEWSRAWVVGPGFRLGGIRPTARRLGDVGSQSDSWRCLGQSLALWHADPTAVPVGLTAFGIIDGEADLTADDRVLVELIAADMLADLERRLAAFVERSSSAWRTGRSDLPEAHDSMTIAVTAGSHGSVLCIVIAAAQFARLVREALPEPPPIQLGRSQDALRRHTVTVGALLGRSVLSLAELEALSTGDVVVLDRALGAPLPLAVDGVAALTGQCRVTSIENALALEITAAPAGGTM
jgi:flagellar motor switch/type III secretory pathway protein FliN